MTSATAKKAYDIRSCQTKTLAVRILQGYQITKTKCTQCGVPLMKYEGVSSCVICPEVVDTTAEGGEDGGVEIINNLLSGSMLGSMSSSVQSDTEEFKETDSNNNASSDKVVASSYSIESDVDCVPVDGSDERGEGVPSEVSAEVTTREQKEEVAPHSSETKKESNSVKNILFMKKIGEIVQKKKLQQQQQAETQELKTHKHASINTDPPVKISLADTSPIKQILCESPTASSKRMGINNIAGDESAKRCYMPAWESKMNSVTKEDLEGKIKTMAGVDDREEYNSEVVTADKSPKPENDDFFREIRQRAAIKQKMNPFQARARDEPDDFSKVDTFKAVAHDNPVSHIAIGPKVESVTSLRHEAQMKAEEEELKKQQQRWESARLRKMEEKKMEESMTYHKKEIPPSNIPLDELKGITEQCLKEETVPEPFDENKVQPETETKGESETKDEEAQRPVTDLVSDDAQQDSAESVLARTDQLLKNTDDVLVETKTHLSTKKRPEQTEIIEEIKVLEEVASSSDSLADSMKEHSKRIVALEAKTLQKYTNIALTTTNPNPSSASLKSLSTAEKDKRKELRKNVVELEAEALRKHSEAALAALNARQALDKMMENRNKREADKKKRRKSHEKQSKIEELSISSSLSTKESKEERPNDRFHSVESGSLSQYSDYEYRHSNDDGSRERGRTITPPPRERRSSRAMARVANQSEKARIRTQSLERDHHRSRSEHRNKMRMPPNIMLPSLQSASPRHHSSPAQKPSRPHLLPYSPRASAPRRSSHQPTQRPSSHRSFSPTPSSNMNVNFNMERGTRLPYGSMTPRTAHEQQRFEFQGNQMASRNFESMMLASNQTVQERMLDQQQPRALNSGHPYQYGIQRPMLNRNMNYYQPEQVSMNRQYQERMNHHHHQPRIVMPEQTPTIQQQRPMYNSYPRPQFDPAMQSTRMNSPKVRFQHPFEPQFDGPVNVQYVDQPVNVQYSMDPNAYSYMQDSRNDFSSMRHDGTSMRW